MRVPSWLRTLAARLTRTRVRQARHHSTFRPRVEELEDRLTPSGGGLLDPTFNGTGTETLPSSTCYAAAGVAIQPDGKIVSVGDVTAKASRAISVVRMNPNGTLDTTFNGTGTVVLKAGQGVGGSSVALQPDGKILVGGSALAKLNPSDYEYVVARLNADGSLDRTFGNNRGLWLSNPTPYPESVQKLAVLTDAANHVTGVMVGGTGFVGAYRSFAAIKLTAAGLPDTTFGSGGTALAHVGGTSNGNLVKGMAVTPAGGVIMVGDVGNDAGVVAFTPAGQLDTTFNGTGYRQDPLAGAGGASGYDAVTIQPAAGGGYGIVAAGYGVPSTPANSLSSAVVARYTPAGQFDPTFGTAGIVVIAAAAEFHDVGLEADGSIVVAGDAWYTNASGQSLRQMAVGHLTADGAVDTTFGTAGTGISVVPPIGSQGDEAYSLAIGSDGGIMVAGIANGSNQSQAAFARFTAP